MYANNRVHEQERIDISIGGSILEIFGLVCWMFTDAKEASLRLAIGLISDGLKWGKRICLIPFCSYPLRPPNCWRILAQTGFPGQPFGMSIYSDSIDFRYWTQQYTKFDNRYLKGYLY